jgi:hypothetical protein
MRRLAQHLFTLGSAVSLVACAVVCVLWVRSYHVTTAREFRRAGVVWELASDHGRLRVDNEPQRVLERAEWSREWKVLSDECMSLYRQSLAVRELNRPWRIRSREAWSTPTTAAAMTLTTAAIESEMARLRALALANANARRAMSFKPQYKTAFVAHAAPHALLAAVLALAPACHLALAVRSARRRRSRLAHRLCLRCGYDLRVQLGLSEPGKSNGRAHAAIARCPECGTASAV